MKPMTVRMLLNACSQYRFIIVRTSYGQVAMNAKIATIAIRKYGTHGKTSVFGFKPCGFQEYITKKVGFYSKEHRTNAD